MNEPNATKPATASSDRTDPTTKNGCFRAAVVVAVLALFVVSFPFAALIIGFGSIAPGLQMICLLAGEAGALGFVLR